MDLKIQWSLKQTVSVLGSILLCIILKGQSSEIYDPAGNTMGDKVRRSAGWEV
jgi:hypothetical protein